MDSDGRTVPSDPGEDRAVGGVAGWVFLEGDRRLLAAGIVLLSVGAVAVLVRLDVLAVGADSSVATAFGSGLTAGVVTLVTIALSVNQLILSRVFGSPNRLMDRLDGARRLRGQVEELAGTPSSSSDPATFLSMLAKTLSDHATAALREADRGAGDLPPTVTRVLDDVAAYGRNVDEQVDPETPVADVLGVIVGPEYAVNLRAVHHLRNEYDDSLPAEALVELEALEDLLESVAVVRQFFKTIALQQDFALLSRQLVYSGLVALVVSVSMTLVYRSGSATFSQPVLEVVVPLAFGVLVVPLALFGSYVLRAASVAYRTVSVGPFVPPGGR